MTTKAKFIPDHRATRPDYPKPGVYNVPYSCTNCGWNGNISITKGVSAPTTKLCPSCECNTARKSLPWRRTEPTKKDPVLIPIIPGAWPKNPTPWPVVLPLPYSPWNTPTRPYLGDIGNDIDRANTHWREDTICIDDPDDGLGFSQ